jgi:ketosteroid isomerase-like protein
MQNHQPLSASVESPQAIAAAIRRSSEEWNRRFLRRNARAVSELYTDDARIFPPPPRAFSVLEATAGLEGRAAVERFVDAYYEILVRKDVMRCTEVVAHGSAATEIGVWQAVHGVDGAQMPAEGYYLRLWVPDTEGVWRIRRETFN